MAYLQTLRKGLNTRCRYPQHPIKLGLHLFPHPSNVARLMPLQVAKPQAPQNHPSQLVRGRGKNTYRARKVSERLCRKYAESRNKWKFISEELYSQNSHSDKIYRHPKQCREHYASFLDPQIKKGPWTKEEDLTLLAHIV